MKRRVCSYDMAAVPEDGYDCAKTAAQPIVTILEKGRQSLPKMFSS